MPVRTSMDKKGVTKTVIVLALHRFLRAHVMFIRSDREQLAAKRFGLLLFQLQCRRQKLIALERIILLFRFRSLRNV